MRMIDAKGVYMVDLNKKDYVMRSRLPELKRKLEIEQNRVVSIKEIAEATGLHRNTVSAWLSPEPFGAVDSNAMTKLTQWANCKLDDLLEPVEIISN